MRDPDNLTLIHPDFRSDDNPKELHPNAGFVRVIEFTDGEKKLMCDLCDNNVPKAKRIKDREAFAEGRKADLEEIWTCMSKGETSPAAKLYTTERLTLEQTQSEDLVEKLGRVPKKHDEQPVGKFVDVVAAAPIPKSNLKMIGKYIDKYGKEAFEGSAVEQENAYKWKASDYLVLVGADHPAALMNDEHPPMKGGKIVLGKPRGQVKFLQPKVELRNKFNETRQWRWPSTLQYARVPFPFEVTVNYGDSYWLSRHLLS